MVHTHTTVLEQISIVAHCLFMMRLQCEIYNYISALMHFLETIKIDHCLDTIDIHM